MSTTSTTEERRRPRVWFPVAIGLVLLAVAAVSGVVVFLGDDPVPGIVRNPAATVDGLAFVEATEGGERDGVSLHAPEGGLSLVYFGFLSCPDVCPMTMADIKAARADLPPEIDDRIEVAFITVDPERDDGERLLNYLGHFFDHGYRALRAPDEATLQAAAERLSVTYEIEEHEPGDDDYGVTHSAVTYLVDDEGTVVRELPFGATPDEFVRAIEASVATAAAGAAPDSTVPAS